MTASVPNRHSPMGEVKKGVMNMVNMGSFVVDQNFLQNQTIKVFVRLRPSLDDDDDDDGKKRKDDKGAWDVKKSGAQDSIVERGVLRKVEGKNYFNVDQVFDENAHTSFLYKNIARSMVHTVLNGKHATIFMYGQTGAGKTYTMQGDGKPVGGQGGIIQSVLSDIFRFSKLSEHISRSFSINVSYVEVYNERVRDLLSDEAGDNYSQGTPTGLPVVLNGSQVEIQTGTAGEIILNCITKQIYTVEDALELLAYGNSSRVVAKTNANNHSSRSHAIFRINVQSSSKDTGVGAEILRLADFNLVDLAGSESVKNIGTNISRHKEAHKINQGLAALSHVINDLSLPPKKRPKQIDYHASKLTHILQPHLSGNAEMAIILCAFPTRSYLEETRLTFRFGARAKLVTVQPAVNELNDESALIKKLQTELRLAKQQLEEYKRGGAPKELRGDAPKSIGVSKLQSMSDIHSLDTKSINYDEISLGYDDMEAGPGHREYNYVSNQENPPPKNWEEGEKIPGMGGREYVMPKNMEGLPPELKEVQLGRSGDDDESGSSAPTPKTREFQDIPLDLGRDYAENDAPYRSSSVDFDNMLKGSDVESGGDLHSSEGDLNNSTPFDVDMMVNPEDTKAARKYLQQTRDVAEGSSAGSGYSSGYGSGGQRSGLTASQHYKTGGRLDQTGHAEEAAQDGPEQSFAGMSEKFGSGMSKPDTLRGASTSGTRKQHGTIVTFDNFHARHGNQVSWDTVDLDTMQPEHAGKPMKALQSLYPRDAPIPREITILRVSSPDNVQDEKCLTDKLLDAETKTHFMQNRLEMADDLVEGIFKDLEQARLCIHDLVYRNSQLLAKLKEKHREDIKEEYQEKEVVVEHYWILKGAMYVGLFFFFSGGYEFFMASVFLVWLILEINLGASN